MTATPKSPLILTGCGCLSFLLALILFVAAYFAGGSHVPNLTSGSSTDDTVVYRNTREGRTGALAEHYTGFEFRYPKTWALKPDPEAANFVTVEHAVDGRTYENLNVGCFSTAGSTEKNQTLYPALIPQFQSQFEQQFHDLNPPVFRESCQSVTRWVRISPWPAYAPSGLEHSVSDRTFTAPERWTRGAE